MNNQTESQTGQHNDVLRTAELRNAGVYYKKQQQLIHQGLLEQVRHGYYRYTETSNHSDIPILTALFPDAVLYLESALDYYNYTDRIPSAWQLAVDYRSSRTRFDIDYPIVKPHFIRSNRFPIGITEAEIDDYSIKIYDRERTICDLLQHRNKIDAEVFSAAVQRYVRDAKRNTVRLMNYAQLLHTEKKVREVLGAWL